MLFLLAGLGYTLSFASSGPIVEPVREPLSLITTTGTHAFEVEMAVTREARAKGLMYRKTLEPNHGMLFDFERTMTGAVMWMKNTPISLDMLFLGPGGHILMIESQTTPGSTELIRTGKRCRAVLELLGGTASRVGAKVGDRVEHTIFKTSD